jgi:hypothetical protein
MERVLRRPGSVVNRPLRPLLRYRLRPLMGKQPGAPRLLLGRDRRRVFAIHGAGRHRLFYRRPLADLIKPALDVGKFPFLRALSQQREVIERRRWRIGLGAHAPLRACPRPRPVAAASTHAVGASSVSARGAFDQVGGAIQQCLDFRGQWLLGK